MSEVEFEGNTFQASADGFVPLAAFSRKVFDLSPNDLGSFFDPEDRFFNAYEKVRHGLRHNVSFSSTQRGKRLVVVCDGGIHRDDFAEFIRRARLVITANDQAFDQVAKQWMDGSSCAPVNQPPSFFAHQRARLLRLFARLLRLVAGLLRRLAK